MVVPLKIDADGVTVFYGTVPTAAYACIRSLANCQTDDDVFNAIRMIIVGDTLTKILHSTRPKPKRKRRHWWQRDPFQQ